MTNQIIPIGQQINSVTASMRKRMAEQAAQANKAFTSGVAASYPLLSIRGKEFTFRLPDGRNARHEQNGFALPFIDVILVDASPFLSKAYYDTGFDPAEFVRPACWSLDSVKPDASAPNRQSDVCATCRQNEFGSKITPAGKKAKACQDHRRMVVLLPHQVGTDTATPLAMRIPQSSLKNLKAHAELLNSYGVDTKACVTRMSFTNEAYPQLTFTYVNLLNEDQWDWIQELAKSSKVQGMLQTPDFENAVSTPQQDTKGTVKGLTPLVQAPPPAAFDKLLGEEEEEQQSLSQPIQPSPMPAQAGPAPQPASIVPTIIDLPDGKRFNTQTGEYIEAPVEGAEPEPELDPDVLALPDNKFFNRRTSQYVDTPYVNAVPQPAPQAKAKAVKAKPVKPKTVEQVIEAAAETPAEVQAPAPVATGNGVTPAPAALESMLKDLLPPTNK